MEINPQQPEQEVLDNSTFSINTWFNNLPIRIIGSTVQPFFYARDVAIILGIKQVSVSIKNFDHTEIVTPEIREIHNLITYKKYGKEMKRDDRIILLTEFGVYRLIINSRSENAKAFKGHIYETLRSARQKESEVLNIISKDDLDLLITKMNDMEKILAKTQKYNPIIYVFRVAVNGNPQKYILREDLDPDIEYEKCKYLYKFTTLPNPKDYTNYNLLAEIYGNSRQVMDSLFEECIDINPKSLKYCRYMLDFDFDEIDYLECEIVKK